jgi:hypothetical protein
MKSLDVLLIVALVLTTLPLAGLQERAEAQAESVEEASTDAETTETQESQPDEAEEFEQIEGILRQEEAMIQGAYAYDAGNRRDPFVSLKERTRPGTEDGPRGECPTGCLIDEIVLTGIFVLPEGPVAQMKAPHEEKSFLIRVGDEFHDGDVIAISADTVRFRQMVDDFQNPKPFREVTKRLNP